MVFYGQNQLIVEFNDLCVGTNPPTLYMHPNDLDKYIEWYDNNHDIKMEYPAKFKGVEIESNPNGQQGIVFVIRRDGLTRKVAVEFK